MKNRILALLLFLTLSLEASYCNRIDSYREFEQNSIQVNGDRYTKFVLDLKSNAIYYFDVHTYPMHIDFLLKELIQKPLSQKVYTEYAKNYDEVKPNYLLCYLVYHTNQNLWSLSLWEGDKATKADIERGFKALLSSFYLADKVHFRPTSTYQEQVAMTLSDIPILTNHELFTSSCYQLLHRGISVGILEIDPPEYREDAIIILPKLIPDITPVRGIITEQFSTPLSHLALRARSWKIPHAGIKEASSTYKALEGEYVYFETTSEGYSLRPATEEEISLYAQPREAKVVKLAPVNLAQKAIKPLTELRLVDMAAYGAKATNLGIASQLTLNIPEGYAIPFSYYFEHLSGVLDKGLTPSEIREKILSQPLSNALLDALPDIDEGYFVRSSTNAEDLKDFNGAGLYETVANVKDRASLEQAIKCVWASVWSDKACKERARYGIDHNTVYGAILLQKSVNADSAGVLVTKDIFDPTETMEVYTINAHRGLGISVVEGALIPEQIIYNYDNKGIKVLSRTTSSTKSILDDAGGIQEVQSDGDASPILTDQQVTALGNSAYRIQRLFGKAQPLDIEWLFHDNSLYILQVRPFLE